MTNKTETELGNEAAVGNENQGVEIRVGTQQELVQKAQKIAARAESGRINKIDKEIEDGVWPQKSSLAKPRAGSIVNYPSHFARLPIFKASRGGDSDNGPNGAVPQITADNPEILFTPWGSVKIWGQQVYAYDDVTFLALAHLCRTEEFKGPRKSHSRKIGLHVVDAEADAQAEDEKLIKSWQMEHVRLEGGKTSVKDICDFLGDARSGNSRESRRRSITRLRSVNLTHLVVKGVRLSRPSFFVPPWLVDDTGALKEDAEWDDRLFYYAGHQDIEGDFHITWTESMTAMLSSFTRLDAQVYARLAPYAKFIYKYAASMVTTNEAFTVRFHKLALYIDYAGKLKTLDGVSIPAETMFRIVMLPEDHALAEIQSMRIDWRELKRVVQTSATAVNAAQKRFELYLPETGRGEIPKLRVLAS